MTAFGRTSSLVQMGSNGPTSLDWDPLDPLWANAFRSSHWSASITNATQWYAARRHRPNQIELVWPLAA